MWFELFVCTLWIYCTVCCIAKILDSTVKIILTLRGEDITLAATSDRSLHVYDMNVGERLRLVKDVHSRAAHAICQNEVLHMRYARMRYFSCLSFMELSNVLNLFFLFLLFFFLKRKFWVEGEGFRSKSCNWSFALVLHTLVQGTPFVTHGQLAYDLFLTTSVTDGIKLWDLRSSRWVAYCKSVFTKTHGCRVVGSCMRVSPHCSRKVPKWIITLHFQLPQ